MRKEKRKKEKKGRKDLGINLEKIKIKSSNAKQEKEIP